MDNKIEIHILILKIFKKVIEYCVELEKNKTLENDYGYLLTRTCDMDYYFGLANKKFTELMKNREIIFKTKIEERYIYFPMFILAQIICKDILTFRNTIFVYLYFQYLNENMEIHNLGIMRVKNGKQEIDEIKFLNYLLQKEGRYWIEHTGSSRKKEYNVLEMIFNFEECEIEQYRFENNEYICIEEFNNKQVIKRIYTAEPAIKDEERVYKYMKKSSKFYHEKPKIIEYTLKDILDYINGQISVYEYDDKKKNINNEVLIESKNPKHLERLLSYGISIDEALESIGF